MTTTTNNPAILCQCPRCGAEAERRPVRVSHAPAEPIPGFGEPGAVWDLATYTFRCTGCRQVWLAVRTTRTEVTTP